MPERTQSLWPIYDEANQYERENPARAREILKMVDGQLEHYTAPADLWHNMAMVASRVRQRDIEMQFYQNGLDEWPEDVDLLCDLLQEYYGARKNLNEAAKIWNRLEAIPFEVKSPYWRYWAFGAIYHAVHLGDVEKGKALLDTGLHCVKRDGMMNLLRTYRNVLVDSPRLYKTSAPTSAEDYATYEENLRNLHRNIADTLESRYKLGIELGLENGHVLALELARLYQEQGRRKEALEAIEQAEAMFTAQNPNFPLTNIYARKVNILMALKEHGKALELLRSLHDSEGLDRTQRLQIRAAAEATGQSVEDDLIPQALNELLKARGLPLALVARQNPQVADMLRLVIHYLDDLDGKAPTVLSDGQSNRQAEDADSELSPEQFSQVISLLISQRGQLLLDLARQHPEVKAAVMRAASQIQE